MTLPTQIDRYPVVEELGRGGMGVVYRAHDPLLDRPVAIKVLSAEWARDETHVARFEREARTLARFNHPNIATIYSLGHAGDGARFLVLELIEGQSLGARLRAGSLSIREALDIARQVTAALSAAHRRDIVHRDLKPENVLLDLEERVKVLDFGLAKSWRAGPERAATSSGDAAGQTLAVTTPVFDTEAGLALGTPGYMSPEQIRGQNATPTSDVFAFGCLLYECLAGRPAFQADNLGDFIARTLTQEPDYDLLPAGIPESLHALLRRCLIKNADDRLADIAEAQRVVEGAIGSTAVSHRLLVASEIPHNLPTALTSFVGRERELERLGPISDETRLLTLTGSGGCGKTRLALKLAESQLAQHPGGVWLVELAAIPDPDQVPEALATVLDLRESETANASERIFAHLAERDALVILDNCEHLLGACANLITELLQRCPAVRCVATSREALGVAGETTFPVPSLSLPTAQGGTDSEAEALFIERARAARPGFRRTPENAAAIREICQRVDGIPLAIELAAARVRAMAPEVIATRLGESFRLLTGGSRTSLPRQQTMRATFDWSYRLLSAEEQLLLRRLSVFAGGCTLEGAEWVGADRDEDPDGLEEWQVLDLVTALVEKSLINHEETSDGLGRYRILETGRQYARDELVSSGESDAIRQRHLHLYLDLARQARPELLGAHQQEWIERLEVEHENILAAIDWCTTSPDLAPEGLRIVASIWRFWSMAGYGALGHRLLHEALARVPERTADRAEALNAATVFSRHSGDHASTRALVDEALSICRELDDPVGTSQALYSLAGLEFLHGNNPSDARGHFEESLALSRQAQDPPGIAKALQGLGWLAQSASDLDEAQRYYEEVISIRRSIGERHGVAMALSNLAYVLNDSGEHSRAEALFREGRAIFEEMGARAGAPWMTQNIGQTLFLQGREEEAVQVMTEALAGNREVGNRIGSAFLLIQLAPLLARAEKMSDAVAALAEALRTAQEADSKRIAADGLYSCHALARMQGDHRHSARFHAAALEAGSSLAQNPSGNEHHRQVYDLEATRESLGESAFEEASLEGRELPYAEMLADALRYLDVPHP